MASKQVPSVTTGQSKAWVFTAHDPTELLVFDSDKVEYAVYQTEICPDTAREHYQGLIIFKDRVRFAGVRKALNGTWAKPPHIERAKSVKNSREYCMKEDTRKPGTEPIEFGTWKASSYGQGARNDLLEIKAKIDAGAKPIEIADLHFADWCRYRQSFQEYSRLRAPQRDWKTHVVLYYGPTGTGKSRRARELAPNAYRKPKGKWWDGYDGQEEVIFDDLDGSWFPVSDLKNILDRYGYQAETKGGHINFAAKTIYITSNHTPWEWYSSSKDIDPIVRRIDEWWIWGPEEGYSSQCGGPEEFLQRTFRFGAE